MKRDDIVKLHQASLQELQSEVTKLSHQLVESRMLLKIGELKDVHTPLRLRRDIARLKTLIHQKQLTGEKDKPRVQSTPVKPVTKKSTKTTTAKKDK